MNTGLLFVYGTLRIGARSPMTRFLSQNSQLVGRASAWGKLYRVAHYPGLVPSRDPKDTVIGDVFRLKDAATVLKRLDIHEGCGPASPKPTEYVRMIVPVRLDDGAELSAWTYLYNWPVKALDRIKSGDFLKR